MYEGFDLKTNHCRLRISPDVAFAVGVNSIATDDESLNQPVEAAWGHCPSAGEMDAYERVLGDAMAGDATLFAREDYVEEAWRIVDPVLKAGTPVYEYEPKTWGPDQVKNVTPPGGWQNPVLNGC
jgi:glucose-6-phosphate 1-dehydrogenase